MSYVYQPQQQQSVMEETSEEETDDESMMGDMSLPNPHVSLEVDQVEDGLHDDDMYSEDGSESSIPDEFIDFSLTYALHTFLATVEGQASVVKGDSLVLLDDANSYWWLVRVLKTEDVGYIPAENIETPYERLARLNKHRNVDLAAATLAEKQDGAVKGRMVLKDVIRDKAKGLRLNGSGTQEEEQHASASQEGRRVVFAPPTYVDHPGITWDEDEEDEDYEGEEEDEIEGEEDEEDEMDAEPETVEQQVSSHNRQESDDGMAWAEDSQRPHSTSRVVPASNNPFAPSASSPQQAVTSTSQSSLLDPAEAAGETRRLTATPAVAATLLPSAVMSQQQARNVSSSSVVSTVSTATSTRSGTPTSPDREDSQGKKIKKSKKSSNGEEAGEKKKKGVLGNLFSRKKDKDKKASKSAAGIEASRNQQSFDSESGQARSSEESLVSGAHDHSPAQSTSRLSEDKVNGTPQSQRGQSSATSPQSSSISPHGLRLQQLDKEIQQSYHHKYLSKSPSTELGGIVSDPAGNVAQSVAAQRLARATGSGSGPASPARPGSIILSPNPNGAPVLSVLRIFAGEHIRADASFKTVLLNETTLSTDLIRQAVQRFHLHGHGEDNVEYYLTVKDIEGDELVLGDEEKPLSAFEDAVRRWREEEGANHALTRTVKRSSVGSISSISSNLSMHPAITKLGMNDFSDDSAVKIFLNRRVAGLGQFGSYESNLTAESEDAPQSKLNPSLTVDTNGMSSPERYSSPSARFTVQVVIHPEDLPDGKGDQDQTRYFLLPRNATVVEAIESGLERFGIQEGVVDGGDDVEDKISKRRSMARVRYRLAVVNGIQERVLNPSSKVLEAYKEGLPSMKAIERTTPEQRRRSRDVSQSTGQAADILPSDPIFVLRKVTMRPLSEPTTAKPVSEFQKQQSSAPLAAGSPEAAAALASGAMSPQQIIAAQRAASRANQKALISAQANASQGVDVVLPDQGTLRSARLGVPGQEQVRYSYISGDGETIDISELIEQEWGNEGAKELQPPSLLRTTTGNSSYHTAPSTPDSGLASSPLEDAGKNSSNDILQGVLQRSRNEPEARLQEKIHRVLDKVRAAGAGGRSTPNGDVGKRSVSPSALPPLSPLPEGGVYDPAERSSSRQGDAPRSNSRQALAKMGSRHRQQPSIASILSDFSTENDTGPSTPMTAATSVNPTPPVGAYHPMRLNTTSPTPAPRNPVVYSDDFGIKQMLAVIQARARDAAPKEVERKELDPVEKMFYGEKPDFAIAHPSVRQSFSPLQARLEALDKELDEILGSLVTA